jgi:hypothetical protein
MEKWLKEQLGMVASLCDYGTGEFIRAATPNELHASIVAARGDGGAGVILVDGRRCFVR